MQKPFLDLGALARAIDEEVVRQLEQGPAADKGPGRPGLTPPQPAVDVTDGERGAIFGPSPLVEFTRLHRELEAERRAHQAAVEALDRAKCQLAECEKLCEGRRLEALGANNRRLIIADEMVELKAKYQEHLEATAGQLKALEAKVVELEAANKRLELAAQDQLDKVAGQLQEAREINSRQGRALLSARKAQADLHKRLRYWVERTRYWHTQWGLDLDAEDKALDQDGDPQGAQAEGATPTV